MDVILAVLHVGVAGKEFLRGRFTGVHSPKPRVRPRKRAPSKHAREVQNRARSTEPITKMHGSTKPRAKGAWDDRRTPKKPSQPAAIRKRCMEQRPVTKHVQCMCAENASWGVGSLYLQTAWGYRPGPRAHRASSPPPVATLPSDGHGLHARAPEPALGALECMNLRFTPPFRSKPKPKGSPLRFTREP